MVVRVPGCRGGRLASPAHGAPSARVAPLGMEIRMAPTLRPAVFCRPFYSPAIFPALHLSLFYLSFPLWPLLLLGAPLLGGRGGVFCFENACCALRPWLRELRRCRCGSAFAVSP